MFIATSTRGNDVKTFTSKDAVYKHKENNTGWQYWQVPKGEFKSLAKQRNPWFAFTRLNNDRKVKVFESLKESSSYTKQQLITAVQDAYGFTKAQALRWIKNASEQSKEEIVKGFRDNARKSFYTD